MTPGRRIQRSLRAASLAGAVSVVLLGAGPAGADRSRPRPRPSAELIAYARAPLGSGAQSEVWVMDGDGRFAHRLSEPPPGASDSEPSISSVPENPVVFVRTIAGVGQIAVKLALPDGSGDQPTGTSDVDILTQFPDGADQPAISDHGRIAFRVHTGSNCDIWVRGASAQRRLTDHGGGSGCDSAPIWSPDGRRLAFTRTSAASPASAQALIISIGGAGPPRPLGGGVQGEFSWAPGRSLLWPAPGSSPQLEVLSPDPPRTRRIMLSSPVEGAPAWSPGDDWAAFAGRQADGTTDIITVASHGGTSVNLTRTPGISESHPTWAYATLPPLANSGAPGPSVHGRSVKPGRGRRHRR